MDVEIVAEFILDPEIMGADGGTELISEVIVGLVEAPKHINT